MTTTNLDPREQIKSLLKQAGDLATTADDAGRDFTPEERAQVQGFMNEAKTIKANLDAAKADKDLLAELKRIAGPIAEPDAKALNEAALSGATVGLGAVTSTKTLGERFTDSTAYKGFIDRHPNGVGRDARVSMDPVHFGGIKALIGSTALPGMTPVDNRGVVVLPTWGRDLTLRDVITVGSTESDVVEYARQLAITFNAAPVPEAATDAVDPTPTIGEGYKPQSNFTFEKVTEPVKTVAHWVAATKRALSDAKQLRTLIDDFLRFGLDEALEDQIVAGDGTGENFEGILSTSGVQSQAYTTSPIVTIRKAMTLVRTVGRARPTAVGLNPVDDEALDLAVDGDGRFFGLGPFAAGPSTIWGLPRVVTEAIPAGTALVADWRYAALWDREQATVTATDSHADFFIRNLAAILAELRAAFGLVRPAAFVNADLTAV